MQENKTPEAQEAPLTLSVVNSPADSDPARHQVDAAVHLANERTFLAWSLTAIVIIGCGVALARTLIALNKMPLSVGTSDLVSVLFYPTTMGLLFLAAGLIVIMMATCRYLSVQEQLMRQRYRPSSAPAIVLLVIVLALSILLAGFLLQLRGNF